MACSRRSVGPIAATALLLILAGCATDNGPKAGVKSPTVAAKHQTPLDRSAKAQQEKRDKQVKLEKQEKQDREAKRAKREKESRAIAEAKTPKDKSGIEDSVKALQQREAEVRDLVTEDPIAAAAYWGALYDNDPKNLESALKYGNALRKIGSYDRALNVLEQAAQQNPQDAKALLEYGKTLTAAGKAPAATQILSRAAALEPKNEQILTAEAVALDQIGDHAGAKQRYETVLELDPDNVATLNNYGLSRALAGDLDNAEKLLRRAMGLPGAKAQVRQNLALILGLQGKFAEAERLAQADLLPQAAESNIAYIRDLLGQPARWNDTTNADAPVAKKPAASSAKPNTPANSAGQPKKLPSAP